MTKDYDQEVVSPVRRAFQEWQEAASEWAKLNRALERKAAELSDQQKQELLTLEKHLNQAADALEAALRRNTWSTRDPSEN